MKSTISACDAREQAKQASLVEELKRRAKGKSLLLSFDDGPEPIPALLSILSTLRSKGITAEFYIQGNEVAGNEDKLKIIVDQGHKIQNHSWSHPRLDIAKKEKVREELSRTQAVIKSAAGVEPTKVRPPFGAGGWRPYDPELAAVAKELSLKINNWDVDTRDWEDPKGLGEKELDRFVEGLRLHGKKSPLQVLMHVQPETAGDLPAFIDQLKRWGFAFAKP
jgi:peptidoglycan-N-acetylglucosamine deacetylase